MIWAIGVADGDGKEDSGVRVDVNVSVDGGGRVDGGTASEGIETVEGSIAVGTKTGSPSGERNSPSRSASPRRMSACSFN